MYFDFLAPQTQSLIKKLSNNSDLLRGFYLTGGTALTLHLGHRQSEDLDFFLPTEFDSQDLQNQLSSKFNLTDVALESNTLNCFVDGVKLQFLYYPYKLLEPTVIFNNLAVSSIIDIACTKIITISARGSKKDFIDLYFLLEKYSLTQIFSFLSKKYPDQKYNDLHLLKSLTYFDDAEDQPTPQMIRHDTSWESIKRRIVDSVRSLPII